MLKNSADSQIKQTNKQVLRKQGIRNFIVTLILFLITKCSLSLCSKLAISHLKRFPNTTLFLIKLFLITKFYCTNAGIPKVWLYIVFFWAVLWWAFLVTKLGLWRLCLPHLQWIMVCQKVSRSIFYVKNQRNWNKS